MPPQKGKSGMRLEDAKLTIFGAVWSGPKIVGFPYFPTD
jgi:hypothetical protein